jgi:hypothetical protein
MRHILLILAMSIGAKLAVADVGNCVRYHVEVEFKDSTSITGHLFLVEYLVTIPESEAELWETMSKSLRPNWTVLRSFHEVVLSNHVGQPVDSSMLAFNTCTEDDVVQFQLKDVQHIRILSIAPCGNDEASKEFYWNGNPIFSDLNAAEIELFRYARPYSTGFQIENDKYSYFMLIAEASEAELLALYQEVSHQLQQLDSNESFVKGFQSIKQKLRESNVVLICFQFPA